MKELWEKGIMLRIIILGLMIILLGFAPTSRKVSGSLDRVHVAADAHNYQMVADNLGEVVKHQSWRFGFLETAGDAAFASGDIDKAILFYKQAASIGELTTLGYLAWGDATWESGKAYSALQIWEIAKRMGVSDGDVLERKADVFRDLGENKALIDTLLSLLALSSTADKNYSEQRELNKELGLLLTAYEPSRAPEFLAKAYEYDPSLEPDLDRLIHVIQEGKMQGHTGYLFLVSGRALANMGYWGYAEKAFENAVSYDPAYAEAWAYLGESQQHTGSIQDPLKALEKALEIDPNSIAANTFMAFYWQRHEDYEKALDYFQQSAILDPDNPTYSVEIGNIEAMMGDLVKGEYYHRKAISLSSNHPKFVREFLWFTLQFNLNLHDVSLPIARQLVIGNPRDPASLDIMGETLLHLGDTINAERFFLRALTHNMAYEHAHLNLGDLYWSQGKFDKARYHYGHVLEISSNAHTISHVQEILDQNFSP